jgi:putative ABC transport system permease protein
MGGHRRVAKTVALRGIVLMRYGDVMDQDFRHVFFRAVSLGWRSLWRDLRAGELRLLIVSVSLAVAALTAVGFFADRLQAGLWRDARQLLGGDAVIVSDKPTPPDMLTQAERQGLQRNTSISFPTMARAEHGAAKLVALKAVSPGYPLRGQMQIRTQDPIAQATPDIPARGAVWVDPGLLESLGLKLGDILQLGDSRLTISAVIAQEPDRGAGFMNFSPRVMLNQADLDATGLVQPASRLTYRMAVAGNDAQAKAFAAWARAQVDRGVVRGVQVESLESGRPEMRQTLDRAEKFLNLVALLAALLCAVAVALAARTFAARRLDGCALLRVLGQSQRTLTLSYATELIGAGLLASVLGVLWGWFFHHVFVWFLAGLVASQLPAASWHPVMLGMGMGLTLLLAFGLPPVLQLAKVPPLRVIRRDMGALQPAAAGVLVLGLVGFAAALLWASSDIQLGLITVGGFALAAGLFAAGGWLALWLIARMMPGEGAPRWLLLATRQVTTRPVYAMVQTSALSLGLLALVLLVLLRTDLVSSWRQATPANAPDRFVINVQPEQAVPFQSALAQAGVKDYDWYPMIRGRLVAINGRAIHPADYPQERAKRLVDREFNLSTSVHRPAHNPVVAGAWKDNEAGAVSVEEGIAQTLNLKLGDRLQFDVAGVINESRITSLRKVDWGSMRANFFVMYPVAQLPDVPLTYMAAFKGPALAGFDNALVQQFPNITSVDMRAALQQVQNVIDQVVQAVEFLFAFTLAAGLMVLLAAVSSTREDRARDFAIMRALGASSRLLAQVQRAELWGVGVLAGFMASTAAMVVGWAMARFAFEFSWTAAWWVPLAGALAGGLLAWAAGWWGLSGVLKQPVAQTLRQAAQ